MTNTVLTDEQIEQGREVTFSTNNPYCPCDSKTMRKAARWAEQAVLQSEQVQSWKKDAERYRFIRSKVYASNAYGRASWKFHYDNLPLPLDNPTRGEVKQHFEDTIDHARRIEGE